MALLALFRIVPAWCYALLLIVALAGAGAVHERHVGEALVQAKWDAAKVVQIAAAQKADAENRAIESRLKQQIVEAQNEAAKRAQQLQVATDSARTQSASLHDTIASLRGRLSAATADAARHYADTASAVLDDCQSQYQQLAATADRLASERQTLIDAWPK